MNDLKALIGRINFIGGQQELGKTVRKFGLQTAQLMRGSKEAARATVEGIAETAAFAEREAESWIDPDEITQGGAFDSADLRHYLAIADLAGVRYVPARQILSLTEDELHEVDQKIALPEFITKPINKGLAAIRSDLEAEIEARGDDLPTGEAEVTHRSREEITDAIYEAMDDVPHDWMVRSNLAGSSMLKALAGSGVIDKSEEGAQIAEGVEVGAGWVMTGNRRRIDVTDKRFIDTFASGHKSEIHYLARPWMEIARYGEGDDPHRHGTPFAGKGRWPMEWRVFVEAGRVTGVAAYYPWVGSATAENAAKALEAVDLAERMIDKMKTLALIPRSMDAELLRRASKGRENLHPTYQETLDRFPRDGLACTLDFIETRDGMMLLEGGPPHMPIGGGHPCAFAGHMVEPTKGLASHCEGVALKLMDHIILADPATWRHGDTEGCILTWEEARELARQNEDELSMEI